MSATVFRNIGELTTNGDLGVLHDAALVLDGQRVVWVGADVDAPAADSSIDVGGRAVLPGWVDSHTHLAFAGDRSTEFAARMAGETYTAGGIKVSVERTRAASGDELRSLMAERIRTANVNGTTWLETKTGYGLGVETEERSARLAAEFGQDVTFLGAHVVPDGWDADDYVALVTGPMLQAVRPYVAWMDVFCERGAFDEAQSRAVLQAGLDSGLGLRVHGNQLGPGPGARLAVELGAASVDHCNFLDDEDIDRLAASSTVATLLPACDLSTRQPFPPARSLIDAGATVALASNCNPGTSYTTSMAFCVATAVLQMHLGVEEAVWSATMGGAVALRRHEGELPIGGLMPGFRADLQVLDAPSVTHLAYRPGMQLTQAVWQAGVRLA
ncbi:imidazolonepropionase [Pseudoclavibacter sp. RFBJ3]|uniref:imidazolonepropionase n=1 Tax=unclassified Pseudoclavibacter TaxID=2615177 RepID=UPI000CE752A7|nr:MULTISPECIES: imidazolonepropionase [unclassified Pseudoclavibacter]PPF84898.1 imidazolonepropionase [Pseudoclavibacter sp. RFBJ5]PPF93902.1 imidazolonepropionase [Pseudoclavibacter sp. RFBJ3]PPF98620.1 imidazolonepropionase [Pseudoclavibacter sp. RFBH5]PPG24419.1 imidazolonepropionase [Pseudoclavibacter sp. RFBI4]